MTFPEIIHRLDARQSGEGYIAQCPAHKDDKASLSISEGDDGRALLHCHAGCAIESIVSALDLQTKDLFPTNEHGHVNGSGPRTIVAAYDYKDVDGILRYQSVRYQPKDFRQRQPDGPGKWLWNLKGVERLPYRLNELKGHTTIWIAEGEKDVDRLWSLGLPATCNAGGASKNLNKPKWTDDLTAHLVAVGVQQVVCLPDNDEPGRAHMMAVAGSCQAHGIVAHIRPLPDVPEKGDVSDYLDQGHTKDHLLALPDEVPAEPEPESEPEPAIVVLPYAFEPAFRPEHFVTKWIEHHSQQCDAALEFHEAAALVALATATPTLQASISGSANGLGTNLFVLMVGDPGRARKSAVREYNATAVSRAFPGVLLPDLSSHEGMIEALADRNGDPATWSSALWSIDEFTDMLSKLVNAQHLAGMRGMLLQLYSSTEYEYKRVSKRRKKDADPEEDTNRIVNMRLSMLACATPTLFQSLDNTSVGSGLLSRFAIVMPESKPDRLPLYEIDPEVTNPSAFVMSLAQLRTRTANQKVRFADGVLMRLDREVDAPLDESAERGLMTVRIGVMARKVAMLAAAGRPWVLGDRELVVTMEDAVSAIIVARRWMAYGQAFESRVNASKFEIDLQRCLNVVKRLSGWVPRRIVAQQVKLKVSELEEIERTLEDRGLIDTRRVYDKHKGGRPSQQWKVVSQ